MTADDTLWVGTSGRLARLKGSDWQMFTAEKGTLPDNRVSALAVGPDDTLWVGTSGGLARLKGSEWQMFTAERGALPDNRVSALAVGADGTLWVRIGAGLARLRGKNWKVFTSENSDLPVEDVKALAVGADGALWVGTLHVDIDPAETRGGLARLHEDQREKLHVEARNLPADDVNALAVGADGALWVGTSGGLARMHEGQAKEQWQLFTAENSFLPANLVTKLVAANGALWVGTWGGLARLGSLPTPPQIVELVGQLGGEEGKITQAEHTFAVILFDPNCVLRSPPGVVRARKCRCYEPDPGQP